MTQEELAVPEGTPGRARLALHEGQVLLRLSDIYPTLAKCVLEMIQNALDADAKTVFVRVDLNNRTATIQDDGEGITPEKFNQALASVGRSVKARKDRLGRFGLGLISPLRKVQRFTVTSQPERSFGATRWTFAAADIEAQRENVQIPMERVARLHPGRTSLEGVQWRTVVKLNGITRDRTTSVIDLDELESDILSNFGMAMRNKQAICVVELIPERGQREERIIRPHDYTGTPLPEVVVNDVNVGTVVFNLFRARSRAGRPPQGVISVHQVNDPFLVPWRNFVNQARGFGWTKDSAAFDALGGGFFEGTISAEGIELHADRTKFVGNDALQELYFAIVEWFELHGKDLINDERERSRSERFQQLGLTSLERWQVLLDDPAYSALRRGLEDTFVFGRLGHGHVEPASGRPGAIQDRSSVRVGQGGVGKERTPREEPTPPRRPEDERDPDRPGDLPLSVIGPRGRPRQLVKHDSLGLQLAHLPLDSVYPWELDASEGVLYFNTAHTLWERVEARDKWVLHYQEWVILQVLSLLAFSRDEFNDLCRLAYQQARHYVEFFVCTSPAKRAR